MSEMSSKAKKLFDKFNYSQTVYHAFLASGINNEYIEKKRKMRDAKRESFEEYVVGLESRITELEAAQRWIPVSERLPEEDTDGNTLMAICRHSGEWVRAPFGAEFADEFVRHYSYWMYAPQPPEVQE